MSGNLGVTHADAGASQPSAENGMQEDPSKKTAALNNRIEHTLKFDHGMVDPIHQEPILQSSNQCEYVCWHRSATLHLKFAHEWCVTSEHEDTPA